MSKNRNSIKGEYGIGYSRNTAEVRDFQELLDSRWAGLNNMEAQNYHEHKMEFVKNIRAKLQEQGVAIAPISEIV